MAEVKSSSLLLPLRTAASVLRKVPGGGAVTRAAGDALDRVGAVSPRGRRFVVYTGAGVLGLAGVVEWPVAVTGAAVAWLTQPRPRDRAEDASHDGHAAHTATVTTPAPPAAVSRARSASPAPKGKAVAAGGTAARAGRATTKAATKGVASPTVRRSKAAVGAKETGGGAASRSAESAKATRTARAAKTVRTANTAKAAKAAKAAARATAVRDRSTG